jgi:diguanylate cyclase (GGDEF)-like protein/PAS domain S-box-containing protein
VRRTIRLLLVDDDEDDIILVRGMFRDIPDFEAQIDWESNFESALKRVTREPHDIYLVDYRIGAETGIEWIRQVRALGVPAPVILLTGQGSYQIDIEAMEAGAADYLVKGRIDAAQLGRSIRYALDRSRYLSDIADSEARYRQLFEHLPMPLWAFDRETLRFVAVNDAAVNHYGYSREEFLGMTILDIRPPDTVDALRDFVAGGSTGYRSADVWKHVKKDGTVITVDITSHDVEIGGRGCRLVLARDVTAERETEARARLLARAFDSSTSGMMITDARASDRPITYANSALMRMTGYTQEEVLGRNAAFLIDAESEADSLLAFRGAIARKSGHESVARCRRKDGLVFWAQITLSPVFFAGEITHFIIVATDLTEQRRHEAELTFLARHDPVTGLMRFNGAEETIQPLIDSAALANDQLAVFHVDIDRFQGVNDSVGYRAADEVLHIIGQRLLYIAGENGRVWRAGGDEFMMAVRFRSEQENPARIAESVREWAEMPLDLASGKLYLTASVGVAVYPDNASTASDLVQCTDAALRRAKRLGRNAALSFAAGHMDEVRDRIAFRGRLRSAIVNNEMVLHYQPQIRARDGFVVGMEALVRWSTSDHGLLAPARFIPLAEDLGVIVELGRWVLREACQQARRWKDMGFGDIRVAVNVSALQLHRVSFLDEVCEALDDANIPATMLEVELTESALMENIDRTHEILHGLCDLGVSISLDDFGIGYSCLSQLRRFPIDRLKIDKSFVDGISADSGGGAITRAIIAMGHELHLQVLAEGVETDAQLGYLVQNHVDEFQGFLFSRPMPAEEATAHLRRRYVETTLLQPSRSTREILLVDDEENVLRALSRVLRRDGYTIHTATSAAEGMQILATQRVQVIMSDQRMPGTSGVEFLSRVKEMYPDTVRIILSGYTDLATVTDAINRGAIYKFLTKPWNDDEIRQQVQEAFRRHTAIATSATA